MSAPMTTEHLAARTARAVAAAVAAGRERGLTVDEPVVLHDVFSVVVHLAPAPVVVRVPTVLAPGMDLDGLAERQRTELAVVAWLAGQGAPVIAPSPLVVAEPVRHDGFSMTFWQYVDRDTGAEPDYVRNAALVADLHMALRDYPGELPFLSAAEPPTLTASFAVLAERPDLITPADLARARREWELLEPLVSSRAAFDAAFPGANVQPIHGDAPAYNIVPTANGALYADFELTTLGPVEWDLAAFGPEAADVYDAAAVELGLRPLDRRVLRFVEAVGMARTIACLALVDELPILREGIAPAIEQWRSQPASWDVPVDR
ncbi:phosphotransferase family protein [Nocardia sp. NPDC058176]|uniref:phosphotransferase family protein n=1 Tax=Nocardia sp. NPDC058176 TaxID=3346368 RepID=UPI0036DD6233